MLTGEEREIWDKDRFMREIFSLNDNGGDANLCYTTASMQARSLNDPLPFPVLKEKYLKYIQAKAELQNGKYTKAEDKIVNIHNFISMGLWKQTFGSQIQRTDAKLDHYLFGPDIIKK